MDSAKTPAALMGLFEEWRALHAEMQRAKAIENRIAEIKAEFESFMTSKEIDVICNENNEEMLTKKVIYTKRLDTKELKEVRPDVYAEFVRESYYTKLIPNFGKD